MRGVDGGFRLVIQLLPKHTVHNVTLCGGLLAVLGASARRFPFCTQACYNTSLFVHIGACCVLLCGTRAYFVYQQVIFPSL